MKYALSLTNSSFKNQLYFIVNKYPPTTLVYIKHPELILASCINKTRNTTLWLLCFYGLKQCEAFKGNNKPLTKESTACHSIHTYRKSFSTPWQFSIRSTPLQTPQPPSHVPLAKAQLSIFHTIEINFTMHCNKNNSSLHRHSCVSASTPLSLWKADTHKAESSLTEVM